MTQTKASGLVNAGLFKGSKQSGSLNYTLPNGINVDSVGYMRFLTEARDKARVLRVRVREGEDPVAERRRARAIGRGAAQRLIERDHEFATKFDLPIRYVVAPASGELPEGAAFVAHTADEVLIDSGEFTEVASNAPSSTPLPEDWAPTEALSFNFVAAQTPRTHAHKTRTTIWVHHKTSTFSHVSATCDGDYGTA